MEQLRFQRKMYVFKRGIRSAMKDGWMVFSRVLFSHLLLILPGRPAELLFKEPEEGSQAGKP